MKLYTHRKAILSALHQARKGQGLLGSTRTEDAAALRHVRSAAQSFCRPDKELEARKRELLTDLSKALAKANGTLEEVRNCSDAMAALRTVAPEDIGSEEIAADLHSLAEGLQAFTELSASAARITANRISIERLLEYFSPTYKRHTGAVPAVRKYDGGHEKAGQAYGPYLDYICAVGIALGLECNQEGVATAFRRMDDEGKHWIRAPFVAAEERFRGLERLADD